MPAEPQSCFPGVAAIIVRPEMRHTMELVQRVARTSASVLISGETGCGKKIVSPCPSDSWKAETGFNILREAS